MAHYEFTSDSEGRALFRKTLPTSGDRRLLAEAEGLAALAATRTVRTPAVIAVCDRELLTERVHPGQASSAGWQALGEELGALHCIPQPSFGFTADNFCGDTPQPNPQVDNGYAFFARHRLGYQGRLAREAGLLDDKLLGSLERLGERLPELIPEQAPALIHGDLWNGNVLFDHESLPVVIDPACYWGWPEAEIAMCDLFGGFPDVFYQAWAESYGAEPGWRERLPIYSLYHLLNHLNLFGSSYHGQVRTVLKRFT